MNSNPLLLMKYPSTLLCLHFKKGLQEKEIFKIASDQHHMSGTVIFSTQMNKYIWNIKQHSFVYTSKWPQREKIFKFPLTNITWVVLSFLALKWINIFEIPSNIHFLHFKMASKRKKIFKIALDKHHMSGIVIFSTEMNKHIWKDHLVKLV